MGSLEKVMHGVSLAGLALLGSATWSLSRERSTAPPSATPASPPGAVQVSDPAVQRDLESLRLRLKELEARPQVAAAPSGQVDIAPAVLAALDDPRVSEKLLRGMAGNAMGAAMGHDAASSQAPLERIGMNDAQKAMMAEILDGSRKAVQEMLEGMDAGQASQEQTNEAIRRHREEVDARARAILTAEQWAQYEALRRARGMMVTIGGKNTPTPRGIDGLGHISGANPAGGHPELDSLMEVITYGQALGQE